MAFNDIVLNLKVTSKDLVADTKQAISKVESIIKGVKISKTSGDAKLLSIGEEFKTAKAEARNLETSASKALSTFERRMATAPDSVQKVVDKMTAIKYQLRETEDEATKSKLTAYYNTLKGQLGSLNKRYNTSGAISYKDALEAVFGAQEKLAAKEKELSDLRTQYNQRAEELKATAAEDAAETSRIKQDTAESAKSAKTLADEMERAEKGAKGTSTAAEAGANKTADQANRAKELHSQIRAAEKELENLEQKGPTKITLGINADVAQMTIAQLVRHLGELKARMREIEKAGIPVEQENEYNAIYEAVIRTNSAISTYRQNLANMGKESQNTTTAMQDLASGFKTFSDAFVGISQASGFLNKVKVGLEALGPAAVTAGIMSKEALTMATAGLNLVIEIVARVISMFQSLADVAKNVARSIWNAFKKVVDMVKKVIDGIKSGLDKIKSSFSSAFSFSGSDLKRTLQMLTKYIFGVRSFFFLYRKLRTAVKEGLENLVQFESASNETNHAITELRTSLLYLKNAWAAAFAPIINVVYPILVRFMDLLASIGNAIARFVAALTGQSTVLQALKVDAGDYADSLDKAGGSAGKAAKAQDELNDRLAAFDDLNVLGVDKDKDPTSGSGGGGGADDLMPDINDMFERVRVKMDSFMLELRKAWETGDAFDLGQIIADKISDGLDRAHDWLTGEGRAKVLKVATFIGSLMDGIMSKEDLGSQFGQVIGDAFDLVCDTINTIITPQRMLTFGAQLAGAMNTAIPMIVPKLGETLGNLFRSAISGWFGWVTNADFHAWGQSIADAFNNFLTEMNRTAIKGTKTQQASLNGWEMLGINITETAQGMIDMLATAIANADWHSLGVGIGQLLSNIDFDSIVSGLSDVGSGIFSGLQSAWSGFSLADPKLGEKLHPTASVISTLLQDIPRLIQIAHRLLDSIPWDDINNLVAHLPDTLERFLALFERLVPILETIVRLISEITGITPILDTASGETVQDLDRVDVAAASARTGILALNDAIVSSGGALGYALGAVERGVIDFFTGDKNAGLLRDFKDIDEQIKHTEGYIDEAKNRLTFDDAVTNLDAVAEGVKNSFGTIPTEFENVKGAVSAQSSQIKGTFDTTFERIKSGSIDSAKIVQDNFLLASDNIKNSFIESWGEIKKSISEGGDMFVALSDGMGNTVKSLLNAMINGINISITKPLQDISKSFNVLRTLDVNGTRPFAGIPYLNIPPIPHLAQGAVIPPNKQFMAVLGDQTSGTNIEAPLDTIKAAVGEEFAPYADMIVNAVLQVVDAVNNKPVLSDRDIGKANARFTSQQKLIRGTSL